MRFTADIPYGADAAVQIYEKKSGKLLLEQKFPADAKYGNLRTVTVSGLPLPDVVYDYRIQDETVCDPYAKILTGDETQPKRRCAFSTAQYDWGSDAFPRIPYERAIMYHLHVRNFTRHPKSMVRHKGTFLGLQEKVPYLKNLGINQVKLMPIYEPAPDAHEKEKEHPLLANQRPNCWGYGAGSYFAPRRLFAATDDPIKEVKDMVRVFHQNGIELIMELFFETGTPIRMILDCLTYWVSEYHIDGFHIMGNGELGRYLMGDPVLAQTKLIVDNASFAADAPEGLRTFAEANDGFLMDMRRILKGDEGMLESFAWRVRRNSGKFAMINYITNHDGFTLNDLVSYDQKHNEENGEQNRDGANYNFSWNCGQEGPSRKKTVTALRKKQMKNAFLLMLLSQGTPMILAGDEFGNSQNGNNNPYCLDNEVSWVDWNACRRHPDMVEFVKQAIAFRKKHRVLSMAEEFLLTDYKSCGYPDLSYHSSRAWYGGFEYNSRQLGMMYCASYAGEEEFLYVAYNLHPQEQELALPKLPAGMTWYLAADTSQNGFLEEPQKIEESRTRFFPARSVTILLGKKESKE